jgi:hypothetical protein
MKSFAMLVLAGCSFGGVEGSGKPASEVRQVTGFDALELSGALGAEIAIAAEHRVEISGDDNLVPLVTTELDGRALEIETRKSMRPKLPLVARLAAPRIGAITVAGSSVVTLQGMRGSDLAVNVSGSVELRGNGTVGALALTISGSGEVELESLAAESVTVSVTGSANVAIAASRTLAVQISGSANVTYRGDPVVTKDISGSGKVVRR